MRPGSKLCGRMPFSEARIKGTIDQRVSFTSRFQPRVNLLVGPAAKLAAPNLLGPTGHGSAPQDRLHGC